MAARLSPFSRAVVNTMRRLFPEAWADKTFDNTGLLLEAPMRADKRQKNSVLLTIDLTGRVTTEAIEKRVSVVVAYHPIIFKPLKALTLADSQQQSLLRLAQEGISVYCPHTAVDASPKGLNDWLAEKIGAAAWSALVYRPGGFTDLVQTVISPLKDVPSSPDGEVGMGRIIRFPEYVHFGNFVDRLAQDLNLRHLPIAVPQGSRIEEHTFKSIAICAGGSLLRGLDVDVLFTSELSHHEALAAIESGKLVVAPTATEGILSQSITMRWRWQLRKVLGTPLAHATKGLRLGSSILLA
ncbi:MAG: hypothetical protein M1826_000843 [Phylliscum demangeonii]|nr:MAG: hypothetical protein M1826_000843 [Phylliscum demangeonii]